MPARSLLPRAEAWAQRRDGRIAGTNPSVILVRTARSCVEDRVTGLAAEMAFFALLSLIPAVVALGAGLSSLARIVDPDAVERGRRAAIEGLSAVFTPEVRAEVIEPLLVGLLDGERGGLALSGILASLYLASRVLTATIRALDAAYNVEDGRGFVQQRLIALVLALIAVAVVTLTLVAAVVGPLFGTGQEIAEQLQLGGFFAAVWQLARWPVVLLVAIGFFATVYKLGPNVRNRWRDCLPGAVLGVLLWLAASVGLRVYLSTVGAPGDQFTSTDEAVAILGQVVGAVVAAVLWTFLSSLALLVGGELNSEISAARGRVDVQQPPGAAA